MGHPGRLRQRVNARTRYAALANEARRGLENPLAVLGCLFLGDAHVADPDPEWVLTFIIAIVI